MSQSDTVEALSEDRLFAHRHVGVSAEDLQAMASEIGFENLDALIDVVVPEKIRLNGRLGLPRPVTEHEVLRRLRSHAERNLVAKSYLGQGYSDTVTPPVIQRNILENPGWYTAYTPYQAEIAQGRLEALINFQTIVTDLTGLAIANASLLDEGTAAAEAMALAWAVRSHPHARKLFVSETCHPQTIAVIRTRAEPIGVEVVVGDFARFDLDQEFFGILLQYPATDGTIPDYRSLIGQAAARKMITICAADLLSLTLLTPPGELGADICVGSSQRFGVPLGFGGPHAAFFATKDIYKRYLPGRLVGVSRDAAGRLGYRLALQTREQHIRRDKATSNICTAQVLLAVIASMYAVYHGPNGLKAIAQRIRRSAERFRSALARAGYATLPGPIFDTIWVDPGDRRDTVLSRCRDRNINLRLYPNGGLGISLDETTSPQDLDELGEVFQLSGGVDDDVELPEYCSRETPFLRHPVFHRYHTETELMRYLKRLENRDLSLTSSMIPLGSCTMKLNAAVEMLPITWPELNRIHPFAPADQTEGYAAIVRELAEWLGKITGFDAVSLQPNAGSQGEYAGLLAIREFYRNRDDHQRDVCLIPVSAHGTNPASAVMAGYEVVSVLCDAQGNIDVADLRAKTEKYRDRLGALMVTYPSTHGVFEENISEVCGLVHQAGGQVYMDGANMNAQVGLCRPADIGADVCHLNLHKTFCIPHGGGGPGVGPIGVKAHLAPFLPGHPASEQLSKNVVGPVAAAPYGSAGILSISWVYLALMGDEGLLLATKAAITNANYVAKKLSKFYPVLYTGRGGLVGHECIVDFRQFKKSAGIEVEDVAKRLMDYGFHAPTMSWPVPGTMMIEPTESESRAELDRFCDAMISIHGEIRAIETGEADRLDNPLKRAPHTAQDLLVEQWEHAYSRESAAYPAPWTREAKFWPAVGRIDNVYGDRNLFCSCITVEEAAVDS